ncbi:MAG: ion transporter [Hyphomicrobiales bacterium]|nr:ion transporter [Rickettsiales bacterium]MCP5361448.1 ion transporter [Hyphomicrobiales bacterium]
MDIYASRKVVRKALDGKGYTALFIQLLIIISLIAFSLETVPNLSTTSEKVLSFIEFITIIAFTIEYVLRLLTYDKPLRFVFSWWGVIDALAIFPYYLAIGVDLRAIRILRLFRLVRILKIFRNSHAIRRLTRTLYLAKDELLFFLGFSLIILYLSAVGIYYCEHEAQPESFSSIPHSLWWAIATLTTVGYGDIYPVTVWGKIFTSIVVMVGLGFIAMPAGILTAALSQARREEKHQHTND